MLRLLANVSWSDGELAEEEAEGLERLIKSSDLDDDERETARGWLKMPVALGTGNEDLSENQRLATYQMAVRIAYSDNALADAERAALDRVRDALGLDEAQAVEIEDEMPKHD